MCLLLPADMAESEIGSPRWRTHYGPDATTPILEVHDLNLGRLSFEEYVEGDSARCPGA